MRVHGVIAAGLVALGLAWSPRQFSGAAPHDDVRGTLAAQRAVDARRMETWAAVNGSFPPPPTRAGSGRGERGATWRSWRAKRPSRRRERPGITPGSA